mmetsp:Transcript_42734/g.138613  ORF Transcript_42734/g.138613 Transcript_42734/m.138613 type:complete len:207 (+) Transcript_42734:316-936(+)
MSVTLLRREEGGGRLWRGRSGPRAAGHSSGGTFAAAHRGARRPRAAARRAGRRTPRTAPPGRRAADTRRGRPRRCSSCAATARGSRDASRECVRYAQCAEPAPRTRRKPRPVCRKPWLSADKRHDEQRDRRQLIAPLHLDHPISDGGQLEEQGLAATRPVDDEQVLVARHDLEAAALHRSEAPLVGQQPQPVRKHCVTRHAPAGHG